MSRAGSNQLAFMHAPGRGAAGSRSLTKRPRVEDDVLDVEHTTAMASGTLPGNAAYAQAFHVDAAGHSGAMEYPFSTSGASAGHLPIVGAVPVHNGLMLATNTGVDVYNLTNTFVAQITEVYVKHHRDIEGQLTSTIAQQCIALDLLTQEKERMTKEKESMTRSMTQEKERHGMHIAELTQRAKENEDYLAQCVQQLKKELANETRQKKDLQDAHTRAIANFTKEADQLKAAANHFEAEAKHLEADSDVIKALESSKLYDLSRRLNQSRDRVIYEIARRSL